MTIKSTTILSVRHRGQVVVAGHADAVGGPLQPVVAIRAHVPVGRAAVVVPGAYALAVLDHEDAARLARDVLARVIYGFRLSVFFTIIVTVATSLIGIIAGALQGVGLPCLSQILTFQ